MKLLIIPSLILTALLPTYSFEAVGPPHIDPPSLSAIVTAYSSTPDQTDSSPFTTANGEHVRDGGIANNCLDFGQEVIVKSKVYTVNDRMNSRYDCRYFDIWFPTRQEALNFGKQRLQVTKNH